MNLRDVGFGLAVGAALLGLLAVFTPAIDPEALAADSLRSLLGIGAITLGLVLGRRWYRSEPTAHEPGERERIAPVGVPGQEFDELLRIASSGSDEVSRYYRSTSRDRLEEVAVAVLATHRDWTEERAREALRTGAWTEDRVAAQFFVAGSEAADDVRGLLAGNVGIEHPTTRRARRAVAELRRIASAEGSS